MKMGRPPGMPIELAVDLDQRLRALNRMMRGSGYGMSLTAASVLSRLREEGPQRITDLAAGEAVAQPSMTALVDRLARDGLVERGSSPDDARVVLVAITEEGRARLADVGVRRSAALAARLADLTPQDHSALAAVLPVLDRLIGKEVADG